MVLTLPYPPSVNHYWKRNANGRLRIGGDGIVFRELVALACVGKQPFDAESRLEIEVLANMPDNRKRDLDNILKALFDSLEHCGIVPDDSQFDRITVVRGEVIRGGSLSVGIYIL